MKFFRVKFIPISATQLVFIMGDNAEPSERRTEPRSLNFGALKNHIILHKIDVSLWAIRMLTVMFTIGYFLPLFW